MKRSVTFIVLLTFLFLRIHAQPCADSLNIYSFTYQGRTYEIVKELKTWGNAASCAVERGGHLVHINTQEEQDSIWYAITVGAAIPNNYVTVMDGGGVAYIWIGASDLVTEGDWYWDGDHDSTGVLFWTGQGSAGSGNGVAVGGAFYNWGGKSSGPVKEPDNYAGNQDAAAMALNGWPGGTGAYGIAGEWNDIAATNAIYSIIEYDSPIGIGASGREDFDIRIYPQPATDVLEIHSKASPLDLQEILLTTIDGRMVVRSHPVGGSHATLQVGHLSSGVYLLTATASCGKVIRRKVIVQ